MRRNDNDLNPVMDLNPYIKISTNSHIKQLQT